MRKKNRWKSLAVQSAYKSGVLELGRVARKDKIPIICYHRFSVSESLDGSMGAKAFEEHLRYLKRRFAPITFRELDGLQQGVASRAHPVLVTVDDGYRDFFDVALPLLKKYQFAATLFVATRFVDGEVWLWPDIINYLILKTEEKRAELPDFNLSFKCNTSDAKRRTCSRLHAFYKTMTEQQQERFLVQLEETLKVTLPPVPTAEFQAATWSQLRDGRGFVEVGSHTRNHRILSGIPLRQAEIEVGESKKEIEAQLGEEVMAFSYPNGFPDDYGPRDKEVLRRSGYKFAVTCNFGFNTFGSDPLELNRIIAQPHMAAFAKEVSGFELLIHKASGNGKSLGLTQRQATSPITVSACNDDDKEKWDAFVLSTKDSTIFHCYNWRHIFRKAYGNECVYLRAQDKQATVGVLPLVFKKSRIFGTFLVSLPYFDCAGFCTDRDDVREALMLKAADFGRQLNAAYIEFRHDRENNLDLPSRQAKVSMALDLPSDPDRLWSDLKAKVRNQVRKALKENLTVASGTTELLDDFFEIYTRNMRDLGSPSHRKDFFDYICRYFPNQARIFCVKHEGEPLAAGFTIASGSTLTIPWASALREHNQKCPNMLLYWSILQYACETGFLRFSFGRSTRGEGTYHFKKQWGAHEVQLHWQYWLSNGKSLPNLSMNNSKYSLPVRVWKNLPVSVTRKLGPRVIQNLA